MVSLSNVTPYPLAMLLCDQVITDEHTKKKTLVSIFDALQTNSFPIERFRLAIYVRLSDAEGPYVFRLDFVSLFDGTIRDSVETDIIEIASRLMIQELVFPNVPISVEQPGKYEFRLFANGAFLMSATFDARSLVVPNGGE